MISHAAIIALALLVKGEACGDSDSGWLSVWTMPDGSEVVEPIARPGDPTLVVQAEGVRITCPVCGKYWSVTDVQDGVVLGSTGRVTL